MLTLPAARPIAGPQLLEYSLHLDQARRRLRWKRSRGVIERGLQRGDGLGVVRFRTSRRHIASNSGPARFHVSTQRRINSRSSMLPAPLIPAENDFARVPGQHHVEALLKLA